MRKWTEQTAIKELGKGVEINNKLIFAVGGLNGLKQCSAVDFLVNHCGYRYMRG